MTGKKRAPGRPRKTPVKQSVEKTDMNQIQTRGDDGRFENPTKPIETREQEAHKVEDRPDRVPLGQGLKLKVPDGVIRDGYVGRWCRDDADHGQIENYLQAWYEFVLDKDGNQIRRPAGGGATLILMELPEDLYQADMAAQEKMNIDATIEAAKPKQFKDGHNMDEYIPEDREYVVQRDRI